jgi:hypothetical protein
MVRRTPIPEAENRAGGVTSWSNNAIDEQDGVDHKTAPPPAEQAKSTKSRNDKSKSKVNTTKEIHSEHASSTSSPSLLQLQSDVGNLYSISQFLVKRMDFYEKQMELFWIGKQSTELSELFASYQEQMQQLLDEQTHTTNTSLLDQLSVQTHSLQQRNQLSKQWIEKLEADRTTYQKHLSRTYDELKAQKVQQHRIQRELQKVQWQYDRQLHLQKQQLDSITANENGTHAPLPTTTTKTTPPPATQSSHLVDDMMDNFYKEWSFNGQRQHQKQQQHLNAMEYGKTRSSSNLKKKK